MESPYKVYLNYSLTPTTSEAIAKYKPVYDRLQEIKPLYGLKPDAPKEVKPKL